MSSNDQISDHAVEQLDAWFEDHCGFVPEQIDHYELQGDEGAFVILTEEIDTERFKEILEEEDQYEPSVPEGDTSAVAPQKVEEIDGGILYKSAYGTTFHQTNTVPLGGYSEPIDSRGEPASSSVGKTLEMLSLYLENQ